MEGCATPEPTRSVEPVAMQEPLRVILAAEAEARQQLDAAQREARALVAAAADEARHARAAAEAAREAIATAAAADLVAAARVEATQLQQDSRAAIGRMHATAAAHADAGVDAVLALVLPTGSTHGE